MRRLVIHPTHRKLLRMLRERDKEGRPVILLKEEMKHVFEVLPTLQSATVRNQYVYRVLLCALKRPFTEVQHHKDFIVLNKHIINVLGNAYAKVERSHFCGTVISALELSLKKNLAIL